MMVNKGFTLIEIIVVMTIVGVLAAIAIPNYLTSLEQGRVQVAENNLMTIVAKQQKFNEDYGTYCVSSGTAGVGLPASIPGDCGSTAKISTSLNLSFQGNDSFTGSYFCSTIAGDTPGSVNSYQCQAQDNYVILTLNLNNLPVITCTNLSGATSRYCP